MDQKTCRLLLIKAVENRFPALWEVIKTHVRSRNAIHVWYLQSTDREKF